MQIFKLLPTACAVVICASFISVHADETPVQAAARAALEQKMNELDQTQTQAPPVLVTPSGAVVVQPDKSATNITRTVPAKTVTSPTAPAATTPATEATTPEPTPLPAAPVAPEPQSPPAATMPTQTTPATPPPAETKPAPVMTPVEPAAAATITSETNAAPAASGTTPVAPKPENPPAETMPAEVTPATPPSTETTPAAPTPEMKPAPTVETVQPAPFIFKPAPPAITPAAGTVFESPAMPTTIKVTPGVMSATNQINAIYTGKELGLKPIESPLLPVSAAQQAQLQALLIKYKANQISPEEYHNQRAEILAQP
jgi:hypothetical protein